MAEANLAGGYKRSREYLTSQKAHALIRSEKRRSLSTARLLSLAYHPDERVAAMLGFYCGSGFSNDRLPRKKARFAKAALLDRAERDARREGVEWTPLHGKLFESSAWPFKDEYKIFCAEYGGHEGIGRSDFRAGSAYHLAQPIIEWCSQVPPDTWLPVVRSRACRPLAPAIVQALPSVPNDVIDVGFALGADSERAIGKGLLENPGLSEAQLHRILEFALKDMGEPAENNVFASAEAGRTVQALIERPWGATAGLTARVMDVATDPDTGAALKTATRSALIRCIDSLSGEQKLRLLEAFKLGDGEWDPAEQNSVLKMFVFTQSVQPELLLAILALKPGLEIREVIARRRVAKEDREVRRQLTMRPSAEIARAFVPTAGPDERKRLLRALLRFDPEIVLSWLEEDQHEARNALEPGDLARLLGHESQKVRTRAVLATTLVGLRPEPSVHANQQRGTRSR